MITLTANKDGLKQAADGLRKLADSIERGEFGNDVTIAQFVHSYGFRDFSGMEVDRMVTGNSFLVTSSIAFARVAEEAFKRIDG